MNTMQQHMESLLQVVSDTTTIPTQGHCSMDIKLVPLSAKDEHRSVFVTFERIMAAHEIKRPVAILPGTAINWKSSVSICSNVLHQS